MTPNVDERLASIIRSLTEVVLPHLPADASLAQEQVHLAVGHLQILRMQLDDIPTFETEELADAMLLAHALVEAINGGGETSAAVGAVRAATVAAADAAGGAAVRTGLSGIHKAIETLVGAVSRDGTAASQAEIGSIILAHEGRRVEKDRRWFLPFGFDTMEPAA